MSSRLSIVRLTLHVAAVALLALSIAFTLAAILTTAWQTYYDSGTQETHQHGLYFDYTHAKRHLSGKTLPEWDWRYKFGQPVDGDEHHRWKPYQYNTLILLAVAAFLAFVSMVVSCAAPFFSTMAAVWVFISVWPAFLSLAGVVVFYTTAALIEYRYVFTDRRIELDINYSFYLAVVAVVGYTLALLLVVVTAIVDVLLLRRGERPSFHDAGGYYKVSTRSMTTNTPPEEKQKMMSKRHSMMV